MEHGGERRFTEVLPLYTERLVKSRRFEIPNSGIDHNIRRRRAFIFRWPGDEIEGILLAGPLANTRRNASYILELGGGEEIEFYGNKQLHKMLPDLRGKCVRIQYIGHERLPKCKKPRKVYRVWTIEGMGLLAPKVATEQTSIDPNGAGTPDDAE